MIDVSDGLASEVKHLCKASETGCSLYEEKLPIDPQTYQTARDFNLDPTVCALNGGEDYELLFTIKPEDVKKIKSLFLKADTFVSRIGEITKSPKKITLIKNNGSKVSLKPATGFNHFK